MALPPPLPAAFLARPLAHRALHDPDRGRPENSRSAIRAAMAAGYGIEIDLQLSADGHAMVFHDDDLQRLTPESGPLRHRDAETLQKIPLAGSSETLPSLSDVLDLVAGRAPLLIEIKDQDGALGPDVGALEAATAAALADYAGPVAVMSFNPHSIAEMARRAPDLPRGLTTCAFAPTDWPKLSEARRSALRDIQDAASVGAAFISHDHRDLGNPAVTRLADAGCAVLCWTIRSDSEERAARRVASNITFEGYPA